MTILIFNINGMLYIQVTSHTCMTSGYYMLHHLRVHYLNIMFDIFIIALALCLYQHADPVF